MERPCGTSTMATTTVVGIRMSMTGIGASPAKNVQRRAARPSRGTCHDVAYRCAVNYRSISDVAIGTAETFIQTLLEPATSIAWKSHWLITTLDSGDNYGRYADEMRTAGATRGDIRVVPCGVLADPQVVAAL